MQNVSNKTKAQNVKAAKAIAAERRAHLAANPDSAIASLLSIAADEQASASANAAKTEKADKALALAALASIDAALADAKANAPAPNAPAPAAVTLSARAQHLAHAASHRENKADPLNIREHNKIAIGTGIAKYAAKHAPNAAYAARFSSLPPATQAFVTATRKAYGEKPFNAAALDNAKLARCINSGIIAISSGGITSADASGVARVTSKPGELLMLSFVKP